MSKEISVSVDTFALIWSTRLASELNEDQVISRVFRAYRSGLTDIHPANGPYGKPGTSDAVAASEKEGGRFAGVIDQRSGTRFFVGLEIIRKFKNKVFVAKTMDGHWELDGRPGERFYSLNSLSRAIGIPSENAWINWRFIDENKQLKTVNVLRKMQRKERIAKMVELANGSKTEASIVDAANSTDWLSDVVRAMESLQAYAPNGKALKEIYEAVKEKRAIAGHSIPASYEAITRRVLEESSSDSDSFKGKQDLFTMVEGKGGGMWALRTRR